MMLDALISLPNLEAGTLAQTHTHSTARRLVKRTGREGSDFYSYFCFTNNKITWRPEKRATALSSCQSLGSTIFYQMKTEAKSKMHLLNHADFNLGIRSLLSDTATSGKELEETLGEPPKRTSSWTVIGKFALAAQGIKYSKLVRVGRAFCPGADQGYGAHTSSTLHLTPFLPSAFP